MAVTAALAQVKGWLGIDENSDAEDYEEGDGEPEFRPARLGLGAKFLSHNKAVALGGLENHLSKRIGASSKRRDDDDDDEPSGNRGLDG
eukprot:CAMPEP_0182853114 /NCGR_PEP_ID=MMETSP0034_2-20130328/527_1 /TAXON_ID=156128 /ORGANISM="Nephroselmis pyriformis, Strain CCMP717" /LENGTH=88 /DNA_ID=CAMNT_0024983865 /DNA_START=69 /DNA_END=333 /DNA_ORIENTATION=-